MRATKTIVIFSSSLDEAGYQPVFDDIAAKGYGVQVYCFDHVAQGKVPFSMRVGAAGMEVVYDNTRLDIKNLGAAWYRRPNEVEDLIARQDHAKRLVIDKERRALLASLWDGIPTSRWLNSPDSITLADRKLTQLRVAREIGFSIPETVVTNSWDSVKKLNADIIFKAVNPLFYEKGGVKLLYAYKLSNPSDLPIAASAYPGLWQDYIQKKREWRITIVGDQVFDAAIMTHTAESKVDWRRLQYDPKQVTFVRGTFPKAERERCFEYLRRMNLRFGAFDFVEAPDGTIYFLECNPNGNYGWLEEDLKLPISEAIADELIAICDSANK